MKTKQYSKGFSLVEILLVIAVLIILSIGAFIVYAQVKEASDANTETQNITTIIVGVRNLYGIRADYVGLNTGIVNQASIFPKPMNNNNLAPDQVIRHIGGGEVEVEAWGADSRSFAVIYKQVPPELCVKIAQNYGKNVDIILVNDVVVKDLGDMGTDPTLSTVECNRFPLTVIYFIQR